MWKLIHKRSNFHLLKIGELKLYFSYETLIAIKKGASLFIRENSWSSTTGKHLNEIDSNKKIRLSGKDFEKIHDMFKELIEVAFDELILEIRGIDMS